MFAFLLFTANKTNSFVCFLGESTVRQSCFRFYLTFIRQNLWNKLYSHTESIVAHSYSNEGLISYDDFFSWESHSMLIVDYYFAIVMPIHNHSLKVQALFGQSNFSHFLGFGVNYELRKKIGERIL